MDLAGSVSPSEALEAPGGKNAEINLSLLGLGIVIRAIAEEDAKLKGSSKKRESVGYRDYELTRQLEPFLKSGKFKVLLFVNISPDEQYYTQTKVTLNFGQDAFVAKLKK